VNFSDIPFLESDLVKLKNATKETTEIFRRTSFDRLNIEFTFPEKSEWVTLARSAASYGIVENSGQQNVKSLVIDVIAETSSKIDFDTYDGVVIETGWFKLSGGGHAFPGERYATSHGVAKRVTLEFGQAVASPITITHELGHSLFGLEDLYMFSNNNRPSGFDPDRSTGPWDMMGNTTTDVFGWNKLLMGYLVDDEFTCITSQNDTTHFIANIDSKVGNKLVLINLAEGRTLALEARDTINLFQMDYTTGRTLALESKGTVNGKQGLLVYEIDSSINHGDGPINAQKKLIEASRSLTSRSLSLLGYKFEVLDANKNGLLVRVTK
jgi:M6 family metalloprotease-like protein